jgi:hypothetical protein
LKIPRLPTRPKSDCSSSWSLPKLAEKPLLSQPVERERLRLRAVNFRAGIQAQKNQFKSRFLAKSTILKFWRNSRFKFGRSALALGRKNFHRAVLASRSLRQKKLRRKESKDKTKSRRKPHIGLHRNRRNAQRACEIGAVRIPCREDEIIGF